MTLTGVSSIGAPWLSAFTQKRFPDKDFPKD